MKDHKIIRKYSDYNYNASVKDSIRNLLRNSYVNGMGLCKKNTPFNCIQMPYYHHVFDDEVQGFKKQLQFFKNLGDFISIDDLYQMIVIDKKINGRYFCVSFDDGFQNCYENMLPVTDSMKIPVIIYLPTAYIDLNPEIIDQKQKIQQFNPQKNLLVPFLTWEQCKVMLTHGVTFGSHTVNHINVFELTQNDIIDEISISKLQIEKMLNTQCIHFAYPWGRKNLDYNNTTSIPALVQLQILTTTTTNRGRNYEDANILELKRDHLLANWSKSQLSYFFK